MNDQFLSVFISADKVETVLTHILATLPGKMTISCFFIAFGLYFLFISFDKFALIGLCFLYLAIRNQKYGLSFPISFSIAYFLSFKTGLKCYWFWALIRTPTVVLFAQRLLKSWLKWDFYECEYLFVVFIHYGVSSLFLLKMSKITYIELMTYFFLSALTYELYLGSVFPRLVLNLDQRRQGKVVYLKLSDMIFINLIAIFTQFYFLTNNQQPTRFTNQCIKSIDQFLNCSKLLQKVKKTSCQQFQETKTMKRNKHEIYFDKVDYLHVLHKYENSSDLSYTEQQLLLVAKAYFIQELYAECITLLKTIPHNNKAKVLYEKQTLFFKASYLLNPQNTDQLKTVIDQFEYAQRFINDKPFNSYHHNVFKQFRFFLEHQKVISSSLIQQIPNSEQQINQRKEEGSSILQMEKRLSKIPKIEGFPCFLVQKNWRRLQLNYYENKKNVKKMKNKDQKIIYVTQEPAQPGPITNFSIINHIFEIIPYENKSSQFLNIILFPGNEYQIVSKAHWQYLSETYGGIPVRRTFQALPLTRFSNEVTYNETMTVKLLISHLNNMEILQVSSTSMWPYNVLPMLYRRYGLGQLKEEYSEKNFKIVGDGRVFKPQSQQPLKYITFQNHNVYPHTAGDKRFQDRMFIKFDFEKYSIKHSPSNGLVGLTNDKFLCFMNSTLQCLSNTYELSKFFLQNQYIRYLNFSKDNDLGSRGEITCAYADIIKRVWAFNCHQRDREIDPQVFKEVFAKRFQNFVEDSQQDAHQFLNFLLNCLHDDLNVHFKVGSGKILKPIKDSSNFEEVRKTFTQNYETNNESEITQLFKGYTYSTLKCLTCEAKYYNFDMHLTFPLPVPATNPSISFYFISPQDKNNDAIRYNIFLENIKNVDDIIRKVQEKQRVLSPMRFMKYKFEDKKQFYLFGLYKQSLKVQYYFGPQTLIQKLINSQGKFFFILYCVLNEKNQNSNSKINEIEIDGSQQRSEIHPKKLTLIQYLYEDDRKCYPKLMYLETNSSDEALMQIVSEFIPDQALKYSGGVATEKEKLECIQKIKLQKVKGKPYEYVLKVKLTKNLQMFHEKEKVQSIGELAQTSKVTLQTCLNIFQEKDKIQEEQGWICGKCKQVSACEKSEKIYSVGQYLIIVLKRFKEGEKICTKIDYPIQNLDISKYIDESFKLANPDNRFIYNLYGVIIHRGSLNRGHYYSYCKNQQTKKWYLFDDELVRQENDPNMIVNQNAYVLFYQAKQA